ncbi:hypothetical protein [Pseudorhodoplanes sp.]|uniref:hypothetical protein n=1 Tax=Pseudorhodoplanes sp. TaxID=1934341 RepID=UPI003D0FB230
MISALSLNVAIAALSFGEFKGLIVYWSHLISYRCAIREVKIGLDSTVRQEAGACRSERRVLDPYMKLPAGP